MSQVFVGESKDWKLGVVTETASRKGLFDMSPSNGYYALWWSGGQLRALTAPPLTKVRTLTSTLDYFILSIHILYCSKTTKNIYIYMCLLCSVV